MVGVAGAAAVAPQATRQKASSSSIVGTNSSQPAGQSEKGLAVLEEFERWRNNADLAIAVAAIKALTGVIRRSEASTMMGLEIELNAAADALKRCHVSSLSLSAGCDLFLRFVTRTSVEGDDLAVVKARLIERGEKFTEISLKARQSIALLGQEFITSHSLVLSHGFSRAVLSLLIAAQQQKKHFSVIVTEGRQDNSGQRMLKELQRAGIAASMVLDVAMGAVMEKVDMVIVGAEGVVESGGIVNALGTFPIAVVAKALNKPVYVAAESFKFARTFPLDQRDWQSRQYEMTSSSLPSTSQSKPYALNSSQEEGDYTPPEYLSLLFTDLGVLTPSAVSDELIQLYL